MFGLELAMEFPWGWTFGSLALSLVSAGALLLVGTLLMSISLRRFLMGGIFEARVRYLLLRFSWFFAVVIAVPAVWLIWQQHFGAGVLVLIAAAIFTLFQIPIISEMTRDLVIAHRLAAHLWNRRYEIEKLQHMVSKTDLEGALAANKVKSEATEGPLLDPDERRVREEIDKRFAMERFMEKALYGRKYDINDLVEEAAQQASPGMVIGGREVSGTGPGVMAAVGEYLVLLLLSIAGAYIWLGFRISSEAGVDWQMPLLFGVGAGVVMMIVFPAIRWARRTRWEAPCLVCNKGTRRRIRLGAARSHICGDGCEQKLRKLYAIG